MYKMPMVFGGVKMLLIFSLALLLTGCVKMTQNIVISEEGEMTMEAIMDATQLNEAEREQEGYVEKTEEELCEDISLKEDFELDTEECEVSEDKNIVSARGSKMLTGGAFVVNNGYVRFYMEDILNEDENDMDMGAEGIQMFRASGVEAIMNVEMPGKIIAVNRGEFLENKVQLDLLTETKRKEEHGSELIIISKLESATGEVPWDISEGFVAEAGITEKPSVTTEGGADPFAMMMQGMAEAMTEGMQEGFQEESFEDNIPETPEKALETKAVTTPVHKTADLPDSGPTGIFMSLWLWITSLF